MKKHDKLKTATTTTTTSNTTTTTTTTTTTITQHTNTSQITKLTTATTTTPAVAADQTLDPQQHQTTKYDAKQQTPTAPTLSSTLYHHYHHHSPQPTHQKQQQQTVAALVRNLHAGTGVHDAKSLHLPLPDIDSVVVARDDDAAAADKASQQPNSNNNNRCNEFTPHATLPRFIVNIDAADGGSAGDNITTPPPSPTATGTTNSLIDLQPYAIDDLQSAASTPQQQSPQHQQLQSPGGRRLSHFNLALRRFSHVTHHHLLHHVNHVNKRKLI